MLPKTVQPNMNFYKCWLGASAILVSTLLHAQPQSLVPENDRCAKAIELKPGQFIAGLDNVTASKGLEFETPAVTPATCIQSVENDMWFAFSTEAGKEWYEIQIVANTCNTPAGLQALLIRSDDCNAANFSYEGCSNKINTDTIKLFLHQPTAGLRYLIWVDGYDGCFCEFSVAIKTRSPLSPTDYRFVRFDYDMSPAPPLELQDVSTSFTNNEMSIRWKADTRDNTALYIIEQLPQVDASPFARIVGFVDPRTLVGAGETEYQFTDRITPFQQGKRYAYRIVRVATDGSRSVSETFSILAKLSTSFYLAEIKPDSNPDTFIAHYINYKKGQTFTLSVKNATQETVKEMKLIKEPARDGNVTLKMADLPPGEYTFHMSNGKEKFQRPFTHW
jgi:hypothetical protein